MSQNTYENIIFLHGLESSSKGTKGSYFKEHFQEVVTPDFGGSLQQRMNTFYNLTTTMENLVLVGSSFGGLMASIYSLEKEHKVNKIILLAPALNFPEFAPFLDKTTTTETIIFQGVHDTVTPLQKIKPAAQKVFSNLTFHELDDDHMLHNSFPSINWQELLT